MKKKLIVANWKMNHVFDEAQQWLESFSTQYEENKTALENVEAVVCPPVFLIDFLDGELLDLNFEKVDNLMAQSGEKIEDLPEDELTEFVLNDRSILLGAQDCHFEKSGSFTGDISAQMIAKLGATYVILGHSERRLTHLETDDLVAKKIKAAVDAGLTPIVCVGENKEVRDRKGHLEFVYKQLLLSIPKDTKYPKLVIAYEPIWSIGTGLVPSADEIAEMMKLIARIAKEKLAGLVDELFILYGGSVTEENSAAILAIENVDGLLVGKASLDADKFIKICLS